MRKQIVTPRFTGVGGMLFTTYAIYWCDFWACIFWFAVPIWYLNMFCVFLYHCCMLYICFCIYHFIYIYCSYIWSYYVCDNLPSEGNKEINQSNYHFNKNENVKNAVTWFEPFFEIAWSVYEKIGNNKQRYDLLCWWI